MTWTYYFHGDLLTYVMLALSGFVSLCVASFAARYLKGDSAQPIFYARLGCLMVVLIILFAADHLLLFWGAWLTANALLVELMIHKRVWGAARASGRLAACNFALGAAALAMAFGLLYASSGETSIHVLVAQASLTGLHSYAVAGFLVLAAVTQSALWPCHRWLVSSLNSPTPVSAMMHAGLVNGGGFLLARFAPLLWDQPFIMTAIFTLGLMTTMLGTLWKLMQSDVKRMLACSTMGQMGLMIAQCGLGLFPAAIAHLCWHGLFKAYLFLSSGAAAQEKRLEVGAPPTTPVFLLALGSGMLGAIAFAWAAHHNTNAPDTSWFLLALSFIAATQLALTLLKFASWRGVPLAAAVCTGSGMLYGFSLHAFETLLAPLQLWQPQPLNSIHFIGLAVLVMAWLGMVFRSHANPAALPPAWRLKIYVCLLNASQPHPATITSHRNDYRY